MNFHFPNPLDLFRPKPAHTEVRYVAATRAESRAAAARAIHRRLELEFMAIHMTPEQREAAKARAMQGKAS
jgi:hypothetical protein